MGKPRIQLRSSSLAAVGSTAMARIFRAGGGCKDYATRPKTIGLKGSQVAPPLPAARTEGMARRWDLPAGPFLGRT